MADYRLMPPGVVRAADGAMIPEDPTNRDWQAYRAWLAVGNVPDAALASATPYAAPTPRQWLERLAPATQLAITTAAAGNPQILLWVLKASGSPSIDVAAAETIAGVEALVAAGVLTLDDQATLLAP